MVAKELLKILVCPKCRGRLSHDQKQARLLCHNCQLAYRIEDDIPVMLIEEAEPLPKTIRKKKQH